MWLFLSKLTRFYQPESEGEPKLSDDYKRRRGELLSRLDASLASHESAVRAAKTRIGGTKLAQLVLSMFAALVWHTSSLTYANLVASTNNAAVRVAAQALKAAESTRSFVLEQEQKRMLQHYSATPVAADVASTRSLVDSVADKAAFLLTFERARVDEALVDVKHCCCHSSTTSTTTTPTGDAHQADAYPTTSDNACTQAKCHNERSHLPFLRHAAATSAGSVPASFRCVFEFLFDEDINRLDVIDDVLKAKRVHADLVARNFDMMRQFVGESLDQGDQVIHAV